MSPASPPSRSLVPTSPGAPGAALVEVVPDVPVVAVVPVVPVVVVAWWSVGVGVVDGVVVGVAEAGGGMFCIVGLFGEVRAS